VKGKKTLRFKIAGLNTAFVAIAALILVAIVGLSYREWKQYDQARRDGARSRLVLDTVYTLVGDLVDAETGQRLEKPSPKKSASRFRHPYALANPAFATLQGCSTA